VRPLRLPPCGPHSNRRMRSREVGAGRRLARGLRDLLLPRACAVCRALLPVQQGRTPQALVCLECWSHCVAFPAPWCDRCGHPRSGIAGTLAPCRWCVRLPPTVRAARSVCRVDVGTGGGIVHALKYSGWRGVAEGMAHRMASLDFPADVERERVAVVPVPLAPARERERGFNQSTLLAHHVARRWRLPVWDDLVVRTRHTPSQTRLSPSARTDNVSGAFQAVASRTEMVGAHVILLDDVITTAATLNAIAAALIACGLRQVSYVSFGRAPDAGDAPA
jgi:ComF family protein